MLDDRGRGRNSTFVAKEQVEVRIWEGVICDPRTPKIERRAGLDMYRPILTEARSTVDQNVDVNGAVLSIMESDGVVARLWPHLRGQLVESMPVDVPGEF